MEEHSNTTTAMTETTVSPIVIIPLSYTYEPKDETMLGGAFYPMINEVNV